MSFFTDVEKRAGLDIEVPSGRSEPVKLPAPLDAVHHQTSYQQGERVEDYVFHATVKCAAIFLLCTSLAAWPATSFPAQAVDGRDHIAYIR